MSPRIRLEDLRRAWQARDPSLANLAVLLATQPEPEPSEPVREGVPTFAGFLADVRSREFRRGPREEQAQRRIALLRALEDPAAEVPLPDRLRLHEILLALWEDRGPFARSCLLAMIPQLPVIYGPWRALKRIFKEAEAGGDLEVFAALTAQIDAASAPRHDYTLHESVRSLAVSTATLAYVRRRAWRHLRTIARTCPASYADAASEVLASYDEDTDWDRTWVANQIFFHETKAHNRGGFQSYSLPDDNLLSYRAYPDLWRRSPRPLFGLLERARSDRVRGFAAEALKADFRAVLREVEASWVARLVRVRSESVDELVVWILTNVPRFDQASFRELGLHEAALQLFDSPSNSARSYAAEYARIHARDLPVGELVRLAESDNEDVRRLASDLLLERDPRTGVGLEAWGTLLEGEHSSKLAAEVIRKHFGAAELTPEWFRQRLTSGSVSALGFAKKLLPEIHPVAELGPGFFLGLVEAADRLNAYERQEVTTYALTTLPRFDLNAIEPEALRRLMARPTTSMRVTQWIDEGRLQARRMGLDFLKALAYHPDWEAHPYLDGLRRSEAPWAKELRFDESMADRVLGWLRDVRRFTPSDLGFEWLMQLVLRSEPRYHDFAVETMIKGFVPADFAPSGPDAPDEPQAGAKAKVDLEGASFLFTGKMATMQRKDAEAQVRAANGMVASGVTNKLHFLVIGDEGSPLYGQGKKGTKQVKAEALNAAGANIKIVSETAFLKRLAGATAEVSSDATLAGSERLWSMATAPGQADLPLSRFAIAYLRRHHSDIALDETDRPVDPGAEIPAEFLSFERVRPLFDETRKPLRDFALELARWEFARWSPDADELVRLAENPHVDVRKFVAGALLAEESPEHRRYRIDPSRMTPEAVYRFCESTDESTRELGMELIRRSPRLRQPEELYRLTESPDRRVRAFVIRVLWSLYRDRGIKACWTPYVSPKSGVGAGTGRPGQTSTEGVGRGAGSSARPESPPAAPRDLWYFLRRALFEIPPARLEKAVADGPAERIKPLPAWRAKRALVETMRDLAVEQAEFARGLLPLLEEFGASRGRGEADACFVAATRIRHVHPSLGRPDGETAS